MKKRAAGFFFVFLLFLGVSFSVNAAGTADNSLSTLSLSSGTLSPEFQYNVTRYTATVTADVDEVVVDAVPTNPGAEIISITGNTDLQEGENTIEVAVRAQNEQVAVYTIIVTREAAIANEPGTEVGEADIAEGDAGIQETGIIPPTESGLYFFNAETGTLTPYEHEVQTGNDGQETFYFRNIIRIVLAVIGILILILIIRIMFSLLTRERGQDEVDAPPEHIVGHPAKPTVIEEPVRMEQSTKPMVIEKTAPIEQSTKPMMPAELPEPSHVESPEPEVAEWTAPVNAPELEVEEKTAPMAEPMPTESPAPSPAESSEPKDYIDEDLEIIYLND